MSPKPGEQSLGSGIKTVPVADVLRALRSGAVWCRHDQWRHVSITGTDTVSLLQRIVSADVKKLAVGQGTPCALLTPKARVVAFFDLYRTAAGVSLICDADCVTSIVDTLDRMIFSEDVSVVQPGDQLLGVYGKQLEDLKPLANAPRAPYAHGSVVLADTPAWVAATDQLGEPGCLVAGSETQIDQLCELATSQQLPFMSSGAYEVARIEAGTPRYGAELSEDVLILEAGQMNAVSFDKGCYLGQEPVCRIHFRGQVNHCLVGVTLEGSDIPAVGAELTDAIGKQGKLTSVAWSPDLQSIVGLAYVHRRAAAAGSPVTVGDLAGKVALLPFVNVPLHPTTLPRYKQTGSAD